MKLFGTFVSFIPATIRRPVHRALVVGGLTMLGLSACLFNGDDGLSGEVSATIQPFENLGDGTRSVSLFIVEGGRASCFAPPGRYEPQDSNNTSGHIEGTLAGFDSNFVDLTTLTLGVHPGSAQRSAELYMIVHPAEITLTAITDSTVFGSIRILDTTGAVIKQKTQFAAKKCPVYIIEE